MSAFLTEITPKTHDVVLDLRYAGTNNITGRRIYARPVCYLHPEAENLLKEAIAGAAALGLRLKIFDAFRPSEAQWVLWNHSPNPDFLADPRKGSPHSRGTAVDLTLIDETGEELEMGTGFDDFSPRAHHGNRDVSIEAQRNRNVLLGIMTLAGWDFYRNEWWHYQMFDSRRYPVLDDRILSRPMMAGTTDEDQ